MAWKTMWWGQWLGMVRPTVVWESEREREREKCVEERENLNKIMLNNFCSSVRTMPIIEHYCNTMLFFFFIIAFDTSHKVRILVFCVLNARNLAFDSWWDWRNVFPWTTSANTFVHLNTTWTKAGKSLIRGFNTLDSYQLAVRLLGPHQNLH